MKPIIPEITPNKCTIITSFNHTVQVPWASLYHPHTSVESKDLRPKQSLQSCYLNKTKESHSRARHWGVGHIGGVASLIIKLCTTSDGKQSALCFGRFAHMETNLRPLVWVGTKEDSGDLEKRSTPFYCWKSKPNTKCGMFLVRWEMNFCLFPHTLIFTY